MSSPTAGHRAGISDTLALLSTLAALAAGAVLASAALPYQLDDAYIAYRYADHIASGFGPTFNVGSPPVEGFTSPAWVVLLAAAALAGGRDALPAAGSALGALSSVLCVVVAVVLGRRLTAGGWAGAIAAALLATQPSVTFYAMTGMDAPLFVLVVLVFAGAVDGALPGRYGLIAGAIAIAVRPEGAWLAVMLAAQLVGSGRWRHLREREVLALVGALALGGLAVLAGRLALFGLPLPHTYYAKQSDLAFAWRYLVDNLTAPHSLALLLLAVAGAVLGGPRHRGFLAAALAWIPAVLVAGGDWMPAGRFLLPCFGLLAVAAGGVAVGAMRGRAAGAVIALGVVLAMSLQARGAIDVAGLAHKTESGIRREAAYVIDWLIRNEARSVAAVDIGLLGFRTAAEIVDLGGLTDPALGRLPGTHLDKPIDPAYVVRDRRPDVIVIRIEQRPVRGEDGRALYHPIAGVERRLLVDPGFASNYRLEFMIVPKDDDRNPYYGRLVFARNELDTSASAALSGKVVQLE